MTVKNILHIQRIMWFISIDYYLLFLSLIVYMIRTKN